MSHNHSAPRTPARVLVVDDSPMALRLLQAAFESEHYDVVTATDADDGFDKVSRCRPDVVVTDSVMPGVDGFAFVRRLKENSAAALIPVIMLTAADPSEDEKDSTQPQPDAFVRKSVDMRPLLMQVKQALERRRQGNPSANLVV